MSLEGALKEKKARIWATGTAFSLLIKAQRETPRHVEPQILRLQSALFVGQDPAGFDRGFCKREVIFGLADLGFQLFCERIGTALMEQQPILRLRVYVAECVQMERTHHQILYEFVSRSFYILFTDATDCSGMGGSLKALGDSLFQILAQSFELEIDTVNISYDEYTRLKYQLLALDTAQSRVRSR